MNVKTTILLAVLLAAGAGGWLLVAKRQPQETSSPTLAFLENDLKADQLTRLEIKHDGTSVVLERPSAKDEWSLPGKWPVRDKEVDQLLQNVSGMRSRFVPQEIAGDADQKKFGLDKDTLTLKVKTAGKDHTLLLGEEPGAVNRFSRATFLRLDDQKEAVRLAPGLIAQLARGQDYYQQRRLFPFERVPKEADSSEKIEQLAAKEIAVKAPDAQYELVKAGDRWELKSPVLDRVDPDKLKNILIAYPDIWAERFIDKKGKKLEDFGLQNPDYVLTVTRPKGAAVNLLVGETSRVEMRKVAKPAPPPQFGQPPMPKDEIVKEEFRYAKLADNDQVFEIKADKLKDIALSVSSLRDPMLARFKNDDVRRLEIQIVGPASRAGPEAAKGEVPLGKRDLQDIVLVKDKDKDRWRLEKPKAEDAETSQVTEILSKLGSLEAKEKDILDKADPKTHSLEKPLATVKLVVEEAKGKGEDKSTHQRTYIYRLGTSEKEKGKLLVQVEGWPRINIVDDAVLKLVERPALAYRSRKLLDLSAGDLARIDVQRGSDAFSFEHTKDTWRLAAPVVADIDSSKVSSLASDLTRLEAVEFITDAPKEEELDKVYGLAKPALSAKISFTDAKKTPQTLVLGNKRKDKDGKEKDEYFARLDQGPIFAVRKSLRDDLDRDSLAYRSDKLWDLDARDIAEIAIHKEDPEFRLKHEDKTWKITEPFQAKAVESVADSLAEELAKLKAERFVAHLAKDLTPYGLEKPYLRIRVQPAQAKDSKEPAKERVLLIGKEVEKGKEKEKEKEKEKDKDKEKGRYAQVAGTSGVFVLSDKALAALDRPVYELLDKTLLTVDTRKIQTVRSKGESAFTLKHEKDKWQLIDSPAPPFTPQEDIVDDFLRTWANLRAEKVVAYGPKIDLAVYGLAKPSLSITLSVKEGEKDDKTTEHTVILGKEIGNGQRYARIDQNPAIVVLGQAVVKDLSRSYLDFVNPSVLKFDLDTVAGLSRKMAGGDLDLDKKGDTWQLTMDGKPRAADTITVDNILEKTFRLRAQRVAAYPATSKDLATFGLDNPLAIVTLKLEGKSHVIKLGKEAAGAKDKKDAKDPAGSHFALIDKGEAVVVLAPDLCKMLLARAVNFADRNLASVSGVDQVEIRRGQRRVVFSRADGTWKMVEPTKADAEDAELDEVVRSLSRLRADELVAEKADPKAFGLDRPVVQWTLKGGGKELLQLTVGTAEGKGDAARNHARLSNKDLLFLLSPKLSAKLQEEYRNRKAWDTFDAAQVEKLRFEGPGRSFELVKKGGDWSVPGKTDVKVNSKVVTDTLDTLARLKVLRYQDDTKGNLQLYGLQPPTLTVEVDLPAGKRTLLLGRAEGTSQNHYASVAGGDSVFLLAEGDAQKILRNLAAYGKE